MILTKIRLDNFRNFNEFSTTVNPLLTVIIGENAKGKTNLLESIFVSITGEGFRETKEEELVNWDKEKTLVETLWQEKDDNTIFQITLEKKVDTIAKKFYVNKTPKPHKQYHQYQTQATLFAPEHISIVSGSPDIRRDYFNRLLSLTDNEYKTKLQNYEHALRKRNKILEFYSDEKTLREELLFWDIYLEEQAFYISGRREEYIDFLNKHQELESRTFKITYLKNELNREKLEAKFDLEKRIRRTTIGPQKDDFHIYLKNEKEEKNIHLYGSRSEQRLGVFWLKLNEIFFYEEILKKRPILLLDDVFSELDTKNKKLVLNLIRQYQTVLTTTEQELLDLADMPKTVIKL